MITQINIGEDEDLAELIMGQDLIPIQVWYEGRYAVMDERWATPRMEITRVPEPWRALAVLEAFLERTTLGAIHGHEGWEIICEPPAEWGIARWTRFRVKQSDRGEQEKGDHHWGQAHWTEDWKVGQGDEASRARQARFYERALQATGYNLG